MNAFYNVMFGLPGQGMLLHLSALSLFFLALLLPQAIAAALAGMQRSILFWLSAAGFAFGFVAGSSFMLVFGLGIMGVASWYMAAKVDARQAASYLRFIGFGIASLIVGVSLPISAMGFVLTLLGACFITGLLPFSCGLSRTYTLLPSPMSGFLSGSGVNMALYILIRYGFVSASGAHPPWWGALLLALGALLALFGAFKAALEVDLRNVLSWATIAVSGLMMIGIGAGLWAKAKGYQELSGLALQSVLLACMAYGFVNPLMFIGAGEVLKGVGTASLNWLGGLMRGMPRLGLLMLFGATGMGILPLGPSFASVFLLLHAMVDMALEGGVLGCLSSVALVVVIGLSMALLLIAATKIIGFGFLGRPRSLQAAAAEDIRSGSFWAMVLLACLCLPVAFVPSFVVFLNAVVISTLLPSAPVTALSYAPLRICLLAGLALVVAGIVQTRKGVRGLRETPTWNGGFGRAPAWLPFGDPQTQPTAGGLSESLRETFRPWENILQGLRLFSVLWQRLYLLVLRLRRCVSHVPPRVAMMLIFILLMSSLLIFSLAEGG